MTAGQNPERVRFVLRDGEAEVGACIEERALPAREGDSGSPAHPVGTPGHDSFIFGAGAATQWFEARIEEA